MANTPTAQPAAKMASTTITMRALHSMPKNHRTVTVCWLFSAKANSVKKMKARKTQLRMRMLRRF